MSSAVTPSVPVQALLIYDITATTIIDSSTAAVIDNRNINRQNNYHSYRATGSGTWAVDMQFADGDPTGWVSYGSTAQVDDTSPSGIGYGIDPAAGSHDFIRFVITGDAVVQNYCGLRGVWSLPSAASLSFPITTSQGGTGSTDGSVTTFNTRAGDVSLTSADVEAVEQDLQTSASPTFDGLTTSTATIGTASITSGTVTTLTATSAAIAALTSDSVAVTATGAAPVTVTRTDGGTAVSVVVGNLVLASGTLSVSGSATAGSLVTAGSLTAASGTFSGNVSVGGTLSVGTFASTSPFSITVASGTPLTLSQSSGGTALAVAVGNIVLTAGSVTVSGDVASATVHASGNIVGAADVSGATLTVSGAASAASAAVAGLVAAGSLTSAATIAAVGGVSGGSLTTAGALNSATAVISGAAAAASVKVTAIATYANNAAAVGASVPVGTLYRITGSDNLAIVH